MFDEESTQPQPQSTPAAEPVSVPDMFDGVPEDRGVDLSPETTINGPSALAAGKIIPKVSSDDDHESIVMPPGVSAQPEMSVMQGPSMGSRVGIALAIVAVIALVGGGVYYWLSRTPAPAVPQPAAQPAPAKSLDVVAPPKQESPTPQPDVQPFVAPPATPEIDPTLDTDKDGLPDVKETKLGTEPQNPDTDGDGLTDGAEVTIWGTDPLKKDTDGDGYPDGQEVMNGFNPKGAGKLQ